jgi:hypothetical protein
VWVERAINEEMRCKGEAVSLQEHLLHYPFNKGVAFWLERHNRYSSMEALTLAEEVRRPLPWRLLFSGDPMLRRKAQKQLAYRLPGRPLAVFLYLYLVRFGFVDGVAGLRFCCLRGIYEYMIDLKARELLWRAKGKNV